MKKLDSYKKELEKRIELMIIFCFIALLALLLGNFYLKAQFPNNENLTDYIIGFFTGLELVCVFNIAKLHRVYKDKELLRKMYLKETDEREKLIRLKSGANIVPLFSMVIIAISFVVAYVSFDAFLAMTIVAFAQLLISFILKIYWQRKI